MLTSFRARIRARLIADLRQSWRFWSVRISAIGAALMAAWTALPADVRAGLPYANHLAAMLFVLVALSRLVSQEGKA